jgi:ribA/ribD-fused uncharacterized protein
MKITETHVYFFSNKDYLSNFYPYPFIDVHKLVKYNCVEQWIMTQKAILFNDAESYKKIMECSDPKTIKSFGRGVKNFDENIWNKKKSGILLKGLLNKFLQNGDLKKLLLETKKKTLEASPWDKIYGVGLGTGFALLRSLKGNGENDPNILDEKKWKGNNLLGKSIEKVR